MVQLKGIRLNLWLGVSLNSMGLDYEETFSPVVKITTVRVLLILAARKYSKLWHIDVKKGFLHGELDKDIYVEQPRGLESKIHPEYVCKLKKDLYGLSKHHEHGTGRLVSFLCIVILKSLH